MTIFLIFVLILLIINPNISANAVMSTCSLWFNKLIPVLLPCLIISDFIINSKFIYFISNLLYPFFKILFNIRYIKSVSIIILSLICGAPTSTRMIYTCLKNKDIDENEAKALLYSFSFLSISYTIFILNEFKINNVLFFILCICSCSVLMYIFNRGKIKNNMNKLNKKNNIDVFLTSISKASSTLISILIIMICCNVLLSLFLKYDNIYCIFETLKGHQILLNCNLNYKIKIFLAVFSLVFIGFSLHLQIIYVYNEIEYKKFLIIKLIQSLFISCFFLI